MLTVNWNCYHDYQKNFEGARGRLCSSKGGACATAQWHNGQSKPDRQSQIPVQLWKGTLYNAKHRQRESNSHWSGDQDHNSDPQYNTNYSQLSNVIHTCKLYQIKRNGDPIL